MIGMFYSFAKLQISLRVLFYQVNFKATKDKDPYGDIAIDDFWIAEYCKYFI